MNKSRSMQTPLAAVRGLGSAKSGLHHWWNQRMTAVAMVPLVIWMVSLCILMTGASYQDALAIASHPANATVLILFVAVGFWHAILGLQVILEDYVAAEGLRLVLIVVIRMFAIALAALSILSILRVAL
ncbi:MAG: succinate dehydrogenase, hydrophobic membrane anchor protein [Alphaproteobacteria bacterium]|jgi:succinate dehydrogenase / fumarate reductase membrane anchor subunit|nr:succinate dehydrogenase, hydrophobic membrane anchor protein [Alphaproteobacteria bacterium]MBT4847951.1 succinate dehydrogenase, hydrophobic membrane anchor protein [Alphaproteobacteria bacterium]MBT5255813.1 succinate dehydrogenase, hydrophobic membrane anchor protein [Alphaproteobacteria bacterium]MBT5482453.1 succinate dehydrogenase, hydrophobic membrane anchor protein [Alphaproteobacteria bacterium]MBT5728276.1 succinate dehydrogenase, hydrophobic membrane anchor protein [Alphaproteobac